MKLAFFNNFTLGVVKGDKIVDISKAVPVNEHNHAQEFSSYHYKQT